MAREKALLHRELQHRVKNNLSIISNLLSLESVKLRDPEAKNVFQGAIIRIKSMAEVNQMLNKNPDAENMNLGDYIRNLAESLYSMYVIDDNISFSFAMDEVYINLEKSAPVGLILNELITNSLKYAFPDGRNGEVKISLYKEGKNALLTVADDGIGMDDDLKEGLGTSIIEMLSTQIGGSCSTETTHGNGVTSTLRLPLSTEDILERFEIFD